MKVSNGGIAFIKKYEKFVDHIYDDGFGHPTIGYGHLVRDEDNLKVGQTTTKSEAEEFFRSDIAEVERLVNALPKISRITQNQFDAISSLVFSADPDPVVKKDNPVSANLTIQGSDVSVRDFCDSTKGDFIGKLNTGANVQVS